MKRLFFDPFVWIAAAIILYCGYEVYGRFVQLGPSAKLEQANAAYHDGEKTQNAFKRKEAFNKSLDIYTDLEKEYDPRFGNGKLYYDIANTYYQLGEYPWAILYYYKARALRPRDENVASNLALAQEKAGVKAPSAASPFENIFFFHNYLSVPERLQLFVAFFLLATAGLTLYLWLHQSWWKALVWISGICCILLLLSLGYSYYISPVEAVMVQSSALYRDAGEEYAKVSDTPVPSGIKVKVLETARQGKWLKIMAPDGAVGYLPNSALRVIEH